MIINCEKCHIKVAEVVPGSRIKKNAVMLCERCDNKRKALEMKESFSSQPFSKANPFNPLNGFFK